MLDGIVGGNGGNIYRCSNEGRVKGVSSTGGITGYTNGTGANITNCANKGEVTATRGFVRRNSEAIVKKL